MSTITIEKSPIVQRKAEVAEIVAKHSNKVFGHNGATIKEIRLEAVKQRLESTFSN